jgi:transposase-like protein
MGKRGPKPIALTATMKKAAMMLGQGSSVKQVAEEIGKPDPTIRNWQRRADFAALVNDECNKWLAALRPKAVGYLMKQLKANPLDSKLGWIGQGAARELAAQYARLEQVSAGQLTVTFAAGMPEPKMPAQTEHPEEQGEENE